MKKRVLAVLLCAVMALTLLPVSALAVDVSVSTEETLQDALVDGNTVTLAGSITLTDIITISSGTITLDLAGFTITGKAGADGTNGSDALAVSGGTLTITDSSVAKTGKIVGGNGGNGSSGDSSGGNGGKGLAALAVTGGTVNINGGSFMGGTGGSGGTGGGGEGEGTGGGEGAGGAGGHALYIEGSTTVVNINDGGFFHGGEGKSGSDNGNAWRGTPTLVNCAVKHTSNTLITVLHSAADYATAEPEAVSGQTTGDYWIDGTTLHIYNAKGAAWWSASGATYLSYTVLLEDDIDVSDFLWTPVGTNSAPFTGTFDGQGHTITGLTMNITGSDSEIHAGLFGLNSGTVKNLSITGSNVKANSTSQSAYAGGIAGQNNGTISNCSVTGNISATGGTSANAGGVIGYISSSGTVANCYSTAAVTATGTKAYAGGVAGYIDSGSIGYCYWLKASETSVNVAGGGNYSAFVCYSFENASSTVNYDAAQDADRQDILILLCDALNSWVSARASTTYNTWAADSGNANGGYPVFGAAWAASITGLTLSTDAPVVGTPITATVEPAGATVDYQWHKKNSASTSNSTEIIGETNASYTPAAGDVGMYLYCVATGKDSYTGTASAVTTAAVATAPAPYVPETVYPTVDGGGGTWTRGAAGGYSFTFDAPYRRFQSLRVDGATVAAENYDKDEGSTVITLHADYLATLSVGTHTLRAIFSDGYAQTSFTIAAWENPFDDVSETDWFYEDIKYADIAGLMEGVGDTTFDPHGTTTRGMVVTVLYRLEKEPAVTGECPFDDVASGKYYEDAVTWAAANKIVDGYGGGKFGPENPITREQMAAILYRYAKYKGYDVSVGEDTNILSYNDAFEVSGYAIPAMQWACGAGLVEGDAGNLMPQGNAERCQVAAILHRFIDNQEK